MTVKISANANGVEGSFDVGGVPAATITLAGGIPFMKNVLINGNLAINQRGVTIGAAAAGQYGPDRWKKIDASNMTQIVEEGNFKPSTVYTLSGTGVTTAQITSPATGDWTLPNIPITATDIQLEEGSSATPFELRDVGFELSLCQRYYQKLPLFSAIYWVGAGGNGSAWSAPIFWQPMRVSPTVSGATFTYTAASAGTVVINSPTSGRLSFTTSASGATTSCAITGGGLSAEL